MAIDRKYLITQGQGPNAKTYVLYAGLLDLAHTLSEGRLRIATTLVQAPSDANGQVAICAATAGMYDEAGQLARECSGIGDASALNVRGQMALHLIRMAETRAKARALRDLTNVAEAIDEADELLAPAPEQAAARPVAPVATQKAPAATAAPRPAASSAAPTAAPHLPAKEAIAPAGHPEPIDELEVLRRRYARLVVKARARGVDAPALAPDAQPDDITKAGKDVQALLEQLQRVATGGGRADPPTRPSGHGGHGAPG